MKGEVDLNAYLPPFLTRYGEMREILGAEEPEFTLLWDKAARALDNQFIDSADEKGLESFERLLGLQPEKSDSPEQRRTRIVSKWRSKLPYTYKALTERLALLCGGDFSAEPRFEEYALRITVHFRRYGDFLEVKKLLHEMLPANIYCVVNNSVGVTAEGGAAVYSAFLLSGKHKRISVNVKK